MSIRMRDAEVLASVHPMTEGHKERILVCEETKAALVASQWVERVEQGPEGLVVWLKFANLPEMDNGQYMDAFFEVRKIMDAGNYWPASRF